LGYYELKVVQLNSQFSHGQGIVPTDSREMLHMIPSFIAVYF